MRRRATMAALCAMVLAAAAPARAQAPPPPQLPPPPPPPPGSGPPPPSSPPSSPPPAGAPRGSAPPPARAQGGHRGGWSPQPRGRAPYAGPTTLYVPQGPRLDDANADRVMLSSTAETHPEGTFYLSDYDLVTAQVGYAVSDHVELAASGAPSIFAHQPYFVDLSLKANVHRGEVLRAALVFAFDAIAIPGRPAQDLTGVRGGGVAQLCFERLCRSSLSLGGHALVSNRASEVVPILLSAGLVVHVSSLVKLLLEPSWAAVAGHGALDGPRGLLLGYGVRLSERSWGVDLGFVKPLDPNDGGTVAPGYPFVAVTWRAR